MEKETKKDIGIMLYQFIGGLIVFFLVFNLDFQWITGKIVIIGNIIYYSFLWLGILFPIIIIMLRLILRKRR